MNMALVCEPHHEETGFLHMRKTKTQISCAVTAQLISAFDSATQTVQSLYFLNPKFQSSSQLVRQYSPVCVGPGRKPQIHVFSRHSSCIRVHFESLQLVDYRVEFTKWWTTEFKTIKFPAQGTVFDYYIDHESHKFEPWSKMVSKFELDPDMPLQVIQICLCFESE